MAVLAGHRQMSPCQNEPRLFVPCQAECGGPEAIQRMALFTAIQIRCGGELCLVFILVAIEAALKLDCVKGFFPARSVALRALQAAMLALQRISGRRVFFQTEGRGLETLKVMAGTTLRAASALRKLAPVFVLVTIHALLEGERLFEITVAMACQAIHVLMLSDQWIFGLRVVEILI